MESSHRNIDGNMSFHIPPSLNIDPIYEKGAATSNAISKYCKFNVLFREV